MFILLEAILTYPKNVQILMGIFLSSSEEGHQSPEINL